jgi:S-adenosylmethionine synthetase
VLNSYDFGGYRIDKPISAYLLGKVTPAIGGKMIPIAKIFCDAASSVLLGATACPTLLDHVRFRVENTSGTALDHPRAFYRPGSVDDCRQTLAELRANDTAFCSAYAPISRRERFAIDLENFVNGEEFRREFSLIGSDVKVMLLRAESKLNATVCLPFHPDLTDSAAAYQAGLQAAHAALTDFACSMTDGPGVNLRIATNTKDRGQGAYLTPFGTSLGKGDCGMVGRGNKANGVISAVRSSGPRLWLGRTHCITSASCILFG